MDEKDEARGFGIAEFKAPGAWAYSMMRRGGISNGYIFQGQYYMWTRGLTWMQWGILPIDSWSLDCPIIKRNEPVVEAVIDACTAFWKELQGDKAPEPPLDTLAGHCNNCPFTVTCKGEEGSAEVKIVKRAMGKAGPGYLVCNDEELNRLVGQRQKFFDLKKEADEELGPLNTAIIERIRDLSMEKVILSGWKVAASHRFKDVLQEKKLREAHPDIASEFTRTTEYDQLNVYALSQKDIEKKEEERL